MTAGRRDQLASALVSYGIDYAQEASDALAPVVDRMIRQAQAEALESAADELNWVEVVLGGGHYVNHVLRDRAAALRLTTDPSDVTQMPNARPEMPLEGDETPTPASPQPPDAAEGR